MTSRLPICIYVFFFFFRFRLCSFFFFCLTDCQACDFQVYFTSVFVLLNCVLIR